MRLGRLLGTEPQRLVSSVHSYLELGAWTRSIGADLGKTYDHRFGLFEVALGEVTGDQPLYLEFGVFQGESFHWWLEHLVNPKARFVGFDSFEGLPENWNPRHAKGHFAVDGAPAIMDERGSFEVGWFDETLPQFTVPEHDQLILNVDCDIYSSSIFVLKQLEKHLVPGTIIYFDEFNDRDHELRALQEFLAETGKKVEILGNSQGGVNWLMRIV
jgi:hypothetical protein